MFKKAWLVLVLGCASLNLHAAMNLDEMYSKRDQLDQQLAAAKDTMLKRTDINPDDKQFIEILIDKQNNAINKVIEKVETALADGVELDMSKVADHLAYFGRVAPSFTLPTDPLALEARLELLKKWAAIRKNIGVDFNNPPMEFARADELINIDDETLAELKAVEKKLGIGLRGLEWARAMASKYRTAAIVAGAILTTAVLGGTAYALKNRGGKGTDEAAETEKAVTTLNALGTQLETERNTQIDSMPLKEVNTLLTTYQGLKAAGTPLPFPEDGPIYLKLTAQKAKKEGEEEAAKRQADQVEAQRKVTQLQGTVDTELSGVKAALIAAPKAVATEFDSDIAALKNDMNLTSEKIAALKNKIQTKAAALLEADRKEKERVAKEDVAKRAKVIIDGLPTAFTTEFAAYNKAALELAQAETEDVSKNVKLADNAKAEIIFRSKVNALDGKKAYENEQDITALNKAIEELKKEIAQKTTEIQGYIAQAKEQKKARLKQALLGSKAVKDLIAAYEALGGSLGDFEQKIEAYTSQSMLSDANIGLFEDAINEAIAGKINTVMTNADVFKALLKKMKKAQYDSLGEDKQKAFYENKSMTFDIFKDIEDTDLKKAIFVAGKKWYTVSKGHELLFAGATMDKFKDFMPVELRKEIAEYLNDAQRQAIKGVKISKDKFLEEIGVKSPPGSPSKPAARTQPETPRTPANAPATTTETSAKK